MSDHTINSAGFQYLVTRHFTVTDTHHLQLYQERVTNQYLTKPVEQSVTDSLSSNDFKHSAVTLKQKF